MTDKQWEWYAPAVTKEARKEEMVSLIANEKYGGRKKTLTREDLIILCRALSSFANGNSIVNVWLKQ